MLLGCIADDFTGASDIANTLRVGGMRTVQFVGVPRHGDVPDCEAGIVALKSRSVPADAAIRQSLEALGWLQAQGCRQIVFKYCSTFDSTPAGNIGPVAEALLEALDAPVAVVCPAFPAAGRTVYQGHLFVGDRLLSESGMQSHPLTPMTDPDLRRWLRRQTRGEVGLVGAPSVRQGPSAIARRLDECAAAGRRLAVVDALADDDLLAIGEAVATHRLVTGGSGIALGLPENFRRGGSLRGGSEPFAGTPGPGVVLSGSCSAASRGQLARFLERHPGFAIDPQALMTGALTVEGARRFVRDNEGASPVVHSSADPETVASMQRRHGRGRVAEAVEGFFGRLATALVTDGFTRVVVGGGETSGAVVTALGLGHLLVGPEIDPGVPALAGEGPDGRRVGLALKSGNFGSPDFYERALAFLGTA